MRRTSPLTVGALALVFAAFASAAAAQTAKPPSATLDETRESNLRAYVELMRSDLRSQKVAIITEMMEFTEEEDAKFWPVYREYETEMAKLNDDRIALIKRYAEAYDTLTEATADTLAKGALDLEARRHALMVKTYERVKTVLPPKSAARFLQVERQIQLILDLQIAASLPVFSR